MSRPAYSPNPDTPISPVIADVIHEQDSVEAIVPMIPVVLPLVGAVLIFLLAFIAVFMA